ncbi:GPP34 family phosphoprotein [Paludicola sp. MB14-C6]|uniref:GPP34 family phosphoprotein n=1 Tax=Paludihabitans sp. MB14-C6 TaxID=3070656 RepID=UPI0027DD163B|nr:GPP34 family phosphoprotein [Paludicola sp. MB14-C6]WMJ23390.1 GPP34 family phosphoprotein [Paludicola sp. MB14-C6]
MKKLSYVQQYYICTVNEKGNIPLLNGVSIAACLVMGEITELISKGFVTWDEDNKLSIVRSSDESLAYLKAVYDAIAYKKFQDVTSIVDIYASNIHQPGNCCRGSVTDLLSLIGNSLVKIECINELPKKSLLHKRTKYAPKSEIVMDIIKAIRMAFFENNVIPHETLCLVALLDKSNVLCKYFNNDEIIHMKKRIEEAQRSMVNASMNQVLNYIAYVPSILSEIDWSGA